MAPPPFGADLGAIEAWLREKIQKARSFRYCAQQVQLYVNDRLEEILGVTAVVKDLWIDYRFEEADIIIALPDGTAHHLTFRI